MREKGIEVFVDSINDGVCRLLIGVQSAAVDMPLNLLPKDAREGSRYLLKFTDLPYNYDSNRQEIDKLLSSFHDEFMAQKRGEQDKMEN
ncbi:MAG: hypothetical protein GXZ13_02745 [Synergistaceae bacterium]|nr:hypothetical protein [Synergistaceae bacterium]